MSPAKKKKINSLIFKYRGFLWGILGALILLFPSPFSNVRLFLAAPLLALGQALRFWAAGIIPKYRTLVIGAPKLVTSGPYAFVRNPLYLGNGLMCLALSLISGWQWALVTAAFFYVIYIIVIIPSEEAFLLEKFSGEYTAYMKNTPPIIPNMKNISRGMRTNNIKWNAEQSWLMERHSLYMNAGVTFLLFVRMAWM